LRRRARLGCPSAEEEYTLALQLENEFVVAAPVEQTWTALLDLGRVARCLPGATVEPGDEEGTFKGTMRVKVGPMTMEYRGVARIENVDVDSRRAVFGVQGREVRGQGSASATISNALAAEGDVTRVVVETDLSVTGRPAQFGRGIMQDVAAAMLADFAKRLSAMLAQDASHVASPTEVAVVAHRPTEALELTSAVGRALRERLARWSGLAALRRLLSRAR
jgi:carbon monoxide dehydrogenase subunit G